MNTQKNSTAAVLLSPGQFVVGALLLAAIVVFVLCFGWQAFWLEFLRSVTALTVVFYAVYVGWLRLFPWWMATRDVRADVPLPELSDTTLPTFDVFVAARGEEQVVGRLVLALKALRYPLDRLRVILLLEEDDQATIGAVAACGLTEPFHVIQVPAVLRSLIPGSEYLIPNKPRALTYGYAYVRAFMGGIAQHVTVYDAEDSPEPLQLLKAVARFRVEAARHSKIGCLQARLSFWNPRSSWLSTFYWAEYSTHFRWVLGGFARLGWILPLGGTSNHFLREALAAVAEANGPWGVAGLEGRALELKGPWDPFNVTEDADLGIRLAKAGYGMAMLDSVTYEEAPVAWAKALCGQRSRWVKGYLLTFLVHSRRPLRTIRCVGLVRYLAFSLFVGGTPVSFVLSPIVWGATLLYLFSRVEHVAAIVGFVEGLYPPQVYYPGMATLVVGNMLMLFQQVVVTAPQQEEAETTPGQMRHGASQAQDQYGLSSRLLFIPLWWALMPIAALLAVVELVIPSWRSRWNKTAHGHDRAREGALETID